MKKLYDEIMALENNKKSYYFRAGFIDAKFKAAELAKKYDDEIEKLIKECNELSKLVNDYVNK